MRQDEQLGVVGFGEEGSVGANEGRNALQRIFEILGNLDKRLGNLEVLLAEVSHAVSCPKPEKEWYSTTDLADLLGKSDFTVREKWCNQGRIACEKDPDSGKWRIPAHEVERLRNGGGLKPRQPR